MNLKYMKYKIYNIQEEDEEVMDSSDCSNLILLSGRRLVENPESSENYTNVENKIKWDPRKMAAVICDMWDKHWCKSATARVAEMAPHMNELIKVLRKKGVTIIHAPSDTMSFYKDYPGRKLAQAAPSIETAIPLQKWVYFDASMEGALPFGDAQDKCDCEPPCVAGTVWTRQIDTLEIIEGDLIIDNKEAFYYMRQHDIENVIIMGVHTNVCVLGRPFGIRQLVNQGFNVVLVRDLTDTMNDRLSGSYTDHFAGTELIVQHIEKYWCPTITSDQIIGGEPFRFKGDTTNR